MINQIKNVFDVRAPYPTTLNLNSGEIVSLSIEIRSERVKVELTSAGSFVLMNQAGEVVTTDTGTIVDGKGIVEVGWDYTADAPIPAGLYTYTFELSTRDDDYTATGRVVSVDIPVGAIRSGAMSKTEASVANTVDNLPTTYLGITATAAKAQQVGLVDRIYVDTTVSPALPKMDRVEQDDQSTVTEYDFTALDAQCFLNQFPAGSIDTVATEFPYRLLTATEVTALAGELVGSWDEQQLACVYIAAPTTTDILTTSDFSTFWKINNSLEPEKAPINTLYVSGAAMVTGITAELNEVATAAAVAANPDKWIIVFDLIYGEAHCNYTVSQDKTSQVVTYTLAFVAD
jgi:hypothetical protein